MDMMINKAIEAATLTLELKGWLDTETSPKLGEALAEITGDIQQLVLDFQEVEYISSAGIRMLIRAHKQMQAQAGILTIVHVSSEIMELLQMSALDKKLNIQ